MPGDAIARRQVVYQRHELVGGRRHAGPGRWRQQFYAERHLSSRAGRRGASRPSQAPTMEGARSLRLTDNVQIRVALLPVGATSRARFQDATDCLTGVAQVALGEIPADILPSASSTAFPCQAGVWDNTRLQLSYVDSVRRRHASARVAVKEPAGAPSSTSHSNVLAYRFCKRARGTRCMRAGR